MSDIEIDRDIPIPKARNASRGWPFAKLNVGDSFFMPGFTAERFGGYTTRGKKLGIKFSIRTVTEGGVKGLRVWRVE